jgi:heme/copper-type cytochrome/quinol oxidase subunit 2
MNLAGHAVLVRFVLTAIPIYLLIALKVPKWFIRAIDKIRRGFLWKVRKDVNGGCCLVAWEKVMRPFDLGGQGIHNLEVMGWALQMRWLWIEKSNPDRLWLVWSYPSTRTPLPCLLFLLLPLWEMGGTLYSGRTDGLLGIV